MEPVHYLKCIVEEYIMLQEFRVDNFKSLINVVFKPQQANLLLGTNNSGKTNLCQALRFVSRSSLLPLDTCADEVAVGRSGMTNIALDKSTTDFYVEIEIPYEEERQIFEYELVISPPRDRFGDTTVRLEREILRVTGGTFDDTVLLENRAGRIRLLREKDFMNGQEHYIETTAPTDATMLQRLYDLEANPMANHFKHHLGGWTYYDLSSEAMRRTAHKPRETTIATDGSNLASVLYWLKTANERSYRDLLKIVQKIEPELDLINFYPGSPGSGNDVFMFFEDRNGHSLSAMDASNGTLRFLALAYVLLIQLKHNLSPLCIIEEPENGIYVGFLRTIFEMVHSSPGYPQLVFTSHAPYFIDLFDDHLDGIFVLDRSKGHTSMTQPDTAKMKARLEHYPLGEQHFREMLA